MDCIVLNLTGQGHSKVKRVIQGLFISFLFIGILAPQVSGCVGRILTLAISNSPDQQIMGAILSVYINERTGTTVKLTHPGDIQACHQAVLSGQANMYINYLKPAERILGLKKTENNPQRLYVLVSQGFLDRFKLVWLKPLGYKGPLTSSLTPGKDASLAAPVVSVETLRKFPVLDRLINKLGGRIDSNTLEGLEGSTKGQGTKKAARDFLKALRLI